MKITTSQLKQIIRKELLKESIGFIGMGQRPTVSNFISSPERYGMDKRGNLKKEEHIKLLKESMGLYPEDCKLNKTYELGYRTHKWESLFLGWYLDDKGLPRMKWENRDDTYKESERGTEWEAYMYRGYMAVGTSADKLIIYRELK